MHAVSVSVSLFTSKIQQSTLVWLKPSVLVCLRVIPAVVFFFFLLCHLEGKAFTRLHSKVAGPSCQRHRPYQDAVLAVAFSCCWDEEAARHVTSL